MVGGKGGEEGRAHRRPVGTVHFLKQPEAPCVRSREKNSKIQSFTDPEKKYYNGVLKFF